MKRYYLILLSAIVAISSVACSSRQQKSVADAPADSAENSSVKVPTERVFMPALAPAMLPQRDKVLYMNEHYWDKFDFADTLFIKEVELNRMLTAMAVYVEGYMPDSLARSSMSRLLSKASTSKTMFDYFLMLAERVLHDPNSPFRNDERYIPVLENAIASPLLDEYEKMPLVYDLQIAMQNRIGRKANDFVYTLADGRRGNMHKIKAEYLLIFFSNPGCNMCGGVRDDILASPMLNELTERGKLKVLVLYPDQELDAWREHLGDYPSAWINSYDQAQSITKERTYDLRAIPALYLLDNQKQVMAKDCTDVSYIESLILQAEQS